MRISPFILAVFFLVFLGFLFLPVTPGAQAAPPAARLTYTLGAGSDTWDAAARARIVKAMDEAVALYNANGTFDKQLTAYFSPGTPTADGNYNGTIRFGGQINTRVALHEIAHTLGVGQHPKWKELMKDGKWTGPIALKQLRAFDGPAAELHGDTQHFWPYGLNFDQEGSPENFIRNVKMVAALRADMGIGPVPAPESLTAENLRCEFLTDPRGITVASPRLSWTLSCSRRAEHQATYQILVASSPELLAKNNGNLWDSGKVNSDDSIQIPFAGAPLPARQTCYWKVRAWDQAGRPGDWSKTAFFSIGLLKPTDWTAQWIDAAPMVDPAPAAQPLKITKATYETTDGTISKDVTDILTAAIKDMTLELPVTNATLGGDPAANKPKHLHVLYEYAGKNGDVTLNENQVLRIPDVARSIPYLRKSFTLDKPIQHATLYVTALGLYEMHLNGQRVGDHALAPDWTDYNKRLEYQEYDATALVKQGDNALGARLANGWYAGHIGNGGFRHWGTTPALLAQLEITYTDGTTQRIITDDTWQRHPSSMLASDFMLGESCDARRAITNWNMPGLNTQDWSPVARRNEPPHALEGQISEPVRQLSTLKAKAITEPQPGHWVFDMGQNMVGVVRLKINAPPGTTITLHHAEILNPNGTLYTTNLRSAVSIDTFTCKGGMEETWQPHFTFHGFRYVELTGLSAKPPLDAVTGIVLGTDTPAAGTFSCSDPRINQLVSNIQWGQRGNYLSVPTDCPQRDERLGWMGDAQVFVGTAAYNADVFAFFNKWLVDVDDAQFPDGRFTDVSPNTMTGAGTPAWADAGVICPWTLYLMSGDRHILEQHLPAMIKWVEYCRAHSPRLLRNKDRGSDYGDWLSIHANTPKDVIGTAYFAYSTHLTALAARALGKTAEADKYDQLFADIKAAFNKEYVAEDGRIKGNTQCVYAMALKFDLLPDNLRPVAAKYLDEDIAAKDDHLSTGFVGVSYLLPALSQNEKLDTAYKLLLQDTFPSWLFSVKQGATTIWERWDGWTPEKGFQDPGMNSFNHYALGSCGQWLFDTVAGIAPDPEKPGFRHFFLRPQPGIQLTSAKAEFKSVRGTIASAWSIKNGAFTLNVTIPANTTCTLTLPGGAAANAMESGKPARQVPGVKFLRPQNSAGLYELESGTYTFTTTP